jgi:hypothetical protein
VSESNTVIESRKNSACVSESNDTLIPGGDSENVTDVDNVFENKVELETLEINSNIESKEYNYKIDLSMDIGETEVNDDDDDELVIESTLLPDGNNKINEETNCFETLILNDENQQNLLTSPVQQTQQNQQQQFKYQQHNSPHLRKITKFKARYMTDPLSTQQKDRLQENESIYKIPKRNSLNDRLESHQLSSSSPTSPNNQQEILLLNETGNKNLTKTIYGDSTSTLMSTDSGVSSTAYQSGHQSNSIESIVPDYKLSEEEVDEIEGFLNSDYENEIADGSNVEKLVNEIERKKYYENRNDYSDEFDGHVDVIKQSFDIKTPKWCTSYQDRETTIPIPLVVGQLPGSSDVNNNNIHKLSPQVYSNFNVHDGTSTWNKKLMNKFRFEQRNSIEKSPVFRLDGSKLKTSKSSSLILLPKNNNENISSSSELIVTTTKPMETNKYGNYDDGEKINNNNTENEIQLITSQIPSIVRLNSTRTQGQYSIEKRCATPIDFAYIQQYENNKLHSPYIENYDSTIKSASSTYRFSNQQHPHLMFVNLLHTTPDAT